MIKKTFDKSGISSSVLGFGGMRMPVKNGELDFPEAEKLVHRAYERGVTYFDTAWMYHGGKSELLFGKALAAFPRDSFTIATKCPVWLVEKEEDFDTIFEKQLENLATDYVDFYLLHALSAERFETVKKFGLYEKALQKQKEGKIKYIGFSFHDLNSAFCDILDAYPWDFVQIQYNYIDNRMTKAYELYDAATERDIPIVVMEPVRGGLLAELPEHMEAIFREVSPERSTASFALRWVAGRSNVKVVLSGMSTIEQLEENAATFESPFILNEKEYAAVEAVVEKIAEIDTVPCTACAYCLPCPFGVIIPDVFKFSNDYLMFRNAGRVKEAYDRFVPADNRASACKECGACETKCPQQIKIIENLKKADKILAAL